MTALPLACPECRRDLRAARGGDSCLRCSRYGASRVGHARRRPQLDWEALGVTLFSALCGGVGLGLVASRGGH